MSANLSQLKQRIEELETLAGEVYALAEEQSAEPKATYELSVKGQQWYRGARELMVQNGFSGLQEFDECYRHFPQRGFPGREHLSSNSDLEKCFSSGSAQTNIQSFWDVIYEGPITHEGT